jgi:hypothetical protein
MTGLTYHLNSIATQAILRTLRTHGAMYKPEIARISGYAIGTCEQVLGLLGRMGLVVSCFVGTSGVRGARKMYAVKEQAAKLDAVREPWHTPQIEKAYQPIVSAAEASPLPKLGFNSVFDYAQRGAV